MRQMRSSAHSRTFSSLRGIFESCFTSLTLTRSNSRWWMTNAKKRKFFGWQVADDKIDRDERKVATRVRQANESGWKKLL